MNIERTEIAFDEFSNETFKLWAKDNLLLCGGDFLSKSYNAMTVGWGSFGVIWGKPFAMTLVRPQRHTCPFMEDFDTFTLTAFPENMKDALAFCGSKSGRDYADKTASAGLTAIASGKVTAPGFAEAELIIECRKTYVSSFVEEGFIDSTMMEKLYPAGDTHRIYFGEIVRIEGTEKYRKR